MLNKEATLIDTPNKFGETVIHKALIAKYRELRICKKQYKESVEHLKGEQTYDDAEITSPVVDFKKKYTEINNKYNEFLALFMNDKVPAPIDDETLPSTDDEAQPLTGNAAQAPLLNLALFIKENNAGMPPVALAIKEGDIAMVSTIIKYIASFDLDSSYILGLLSPYTKSYNMFNVGTSKFVKEIYGQISKNGITPKEIDYSTIESKILGSYYSFESIEDIY